MSAAHDMISIWTGRAELSPRERIDLLVPLLVAEAHAALEPIIRRLPHGVLRTRFGSGHDRVQLKNDLTQEFLLGLLDMAGGGKVQLEAILELAAVKSPERAAEELARMIRGEARRFVSRMREPSVAWNLTKRALDLMQTKLHCRNDGAGNFFLPTAALNPPRITPAEISEVARLARQLPQLVTTATSNLPRLLSRASLETAALMLLEGGRSVGQEDLRRFFSEMFSEWEFSGLISSEPHDVSLESSVDIERILDETDERQDAAMAQMVESLDKNDLLLLRGVLFGTSSRELEQLTGLDRQQVYRRKNALVKRLHPLLAAHEAVHQEALAEFLHLEVARRLEGDGSS